MKHELLLYTPKYRIPIGKPSITLGGEYVLTIKKAKDNKEEKITIRQILEMLIAMSAEIPIEETL